VLAEAAAAAVFATAPPPLVLAEAENNVRKKPIFTNLKKRFEHIELPAKLLDYFLRSNKRNINQSVRVRS